MGIRVTSHREAKFPWRWEASVASTGYEYWGLTRRGAIRHAVRAYRRQRRADQVQYTDVKR